MSATVTVAAPAPTWRDDLRAVLPPFLVARALCGLAWLLAAAVADRYAAVRPVQLGEGLVAWDGTWYRDIADVGYHALPLEGVRFFPLYPLVGRVLSAPFGVGSSVALVVVANVAAFAAAVLLRRLVLFEKRDPVLAERSVWLLTLFPSAYVLVWAYSDGLMLVGAVGAFLAARRDRWWWAAAAGLLAGATRPVGVAVAAGLAVDALMRRRGVTGTGWLARAAAVAAPVVGAGAYLVWMSREFGSWSLPFRIQGDLRGEGTNPVLRLLLGIRDVFGVERFGDGLHVPFAIAFIALAVLTFRRWPIAYGVYAAVVLLAAFSATNFNSIERYALNAFPLVLTLATLIRTQRVERIALAVCGSGFVALASLSWLAVYVP